MIGRTVTKALKIEAKQYNLLNFDLGEGVPRQRVIVGVVVALVWLLIAWIPVVATGFLSSHPDIASLVLMLPPGAVIYFGLRDDDRIPQRRKLVSFSLAVRRALGGQPPIVGLDMRKPTWRERFRGRQDYGRAVRVAPRARLISTDVLKARVEKGRRK